MKMIIDFETYSDIDITEHGAYVYADHLSTHILCMSYKIDDNPTELWTPGKPFPPAADTYYAFNATFELLIWNKVGVLDHPDLFKPVRPSEFIDIQAICARYRYPTSLAKAAVALGCKTEKMAVGKALIRKCCTPGYSPTKEDYDALFHYCIVDTDVANEILQRLPVNHLTPSEQRIWELTYEMNLRGVPIDKQAVDAIVSYLAKYADKMKKKLPVATGGFVQTAGQISKIKEFCSKKGVELPNLQADTVSEVLEREDLPEEVKTVLEVRQLTGLSSVKKFLTLQNYYNGGWVQGNLFYHGAGTGRWAGRAFQFHNLPRATLDEPEEYIEKFIKGEEIDRPMEKAKALIRPMIKAPEGYQLIVSDYSSIENRVAAWMCGDEKALDLFRKKVCQYSDMAAFLYGVPIEEIIKGSERYQLGKAAILGCLAKGSLVLTDNGIKNIEEVNIEDKVFDGDDFVKHDGVVNQGYKECIDFHGLELTPDHEILTNEGWRESWQLKENTQLGNQGISLAISKFFRLIRKNGNEHFVNDIIGIAKEFEIKKQLTTTERVKKLTFDILNAGPKRRFMVLTAKGPVIVHNCSYGMGKDRFKNVAKNNGIELTIDESDRTIKAYRRKYRLLTQMWYAYSDQAKLAILYPGKEFQSYRCAFKTVKDRSGTSWLRLTLPSGRALMYGNPRIEDDTYGTTVKYTGYSTNTYKMSNTALTPGLITENVVQATARDILARGKLNIVEYMPEVELCISVHDEAGGLIKESNIDADTMDKFDGLLCKEIQWCKDLPLAAKGYIGNRYKKD